MSLRSAALESLRTLSGGAWYFRRPLRDFGYRNTLFKDNPCNSAGFRPMRRFSPPKITFRDIRGSSHDDLAGNVIESGIVNYREEPYDNCGLRISTRRRSEPPT